MKPRTLCAAVILLSALVLSHVVGSKEDTRTHRTLGHSPEAQSHSSNDPVSPGESRASLPAASTLKGSPRDPLAELIARSQQLDSREEAPANPRERKFVSLYRTNTERYSILRLEETARVIPGQSNPVTIRTAMVGDHVVVRVKGPNFGANFDRLVRRLHIEGRRALHSPGIYLVRTSEIGLDAVPALVERVRRQRDLVSLAEPDHLLMATGLPSDPEINRQWGLNNVGQAGGIAGADIGAVSAWDRQTNAAGVLVSVIDTGIDFTHPDLAQNIWTNPGEIAGNQIDDDHNGFIDDVRGWDFTTDSNNPMDENNHGTHVAGVIGARGNNGQGVAGVAWTVSLMPVKFLDADGIGLTSDAVDAVNYATANGADVTCAAWAGQAFSTSLRDAFGAAATAGVVSVASAGNDAGNTDVTPSYPAGFDVSGLVSIGASNGDDQLASFSNYGAVSVDLVAPGEGIYSTTTAGGYGTFSGTSTAAPLVAGAVALIKAAEPNLTAGEIKALLLATAEDRPSLQGKTVSGGRLDLDGLFAARPPKLPIIAGPLKRNATVGTPFAYTIHAEHDPETYGSSPLPGGLSLDPGTGLISGTPQTEGLFYIEISATNTAGTTSATLELEIYGTGAPEIVSDTEVSGIVGTLFSYQIIAGNSPTSYSAFDLPPWLILDPATGMISGTPSEAGKSRIRIAATNAVGTGDAVLVVTIHHPAPQITSSLSATAILGRPFYYAVTAQNAPETFAAQGLPNGLHINANVGIIAGVPHAIGTYSVVISATNPSGTDTETLTLNVVEPSPETRIFSFSPASAIAGEVFVLTGQGFTGTSKVYFSDWRDELQAAAFSVISDTQLRVTVPNFSAPWHRDYASRITVVSANGATVTLPSDLRVVNSGESILAGGSPGYLINNGGAVSGNGSGGLLMYLREGAAAEAGGGSHTFYVEEGAFANLANSGGNIVFQERGGVVLFGSGTNLDPTIQSIETIEVPALNPSVLGALPRIFPVPQITSSPIATATLGQLFSYTISVEGFFSDGLTFAASGLPVGLTVDTASGLIAGTPTQGGTFAVALAATNQYGTGTLTLTLSVNGTAAPVITNAGPVEASRNQPFSFTVQATNNPSSYGAAGLPDGLAIESASGVISGMPTASGIFRVGVTATNGDGTGSGTLLILVDRHSPRIVSFSETVTHRNQRIRVYGQGFTDATSLFLSDRFADFVPASFTVVSDEELEVEIPEVQGDWWNDFRTFVVLTTPAGATVTIPADYQTVTSTIAPSPTIFYVVEAGGVLNSGGSGSISAYLKRGAVATTGGGGGHTYFAESGALVNLGTGGGGHRVVDATGATITGTPQFLKEVETLSMSTPPALLRIVPIPKIISPTMATGTVGHGFNYQIAAEFSVEPTSSYTATGLPSGLSVDTTTGRIHGTPQAAGTFTISLGATNSYGTGTATLILVIDDPMIPIISTQGQFSLDIGTTFTLPILASYSPTSYEATGLPQGLAINTLTGVISGAPTTGGSYSITVTASNARGTGSATLSFLVSLKPTLITSLPASATTGSLLDIRGQGFTGATAVYFTDWSDNFIIASFTTVSDTHIRASIPETTYSFWEDGATRIVIVTPAGATVTIPPNYVSVTGSVGGNPVSFHIVESGGAISGNGSGGVKAYLKPGATAISGGGGSHTYFAEGGSTINISGGGGHRVVLAPGVTVIGTPSQSITASSLRPSILPLVKILPVPGINSSRTAQASLGLPFIYTTTATNSPSSFGAQGLPPGLSINTTNGIISGRPIGNDRLFEVTLTAANSSGTGSATLLLTVRDDYKQWKVASFSALTGGADNPLAQDMADADGDGMCNLVEYSGGLNPLTASAQTVPLTPVAGGSSHQFRYRRLKGNGTGTAVDGYTLGTITYTVYVSTNLSTWNTGAAYLTQVGSPIDNGDGTETITVQAIGSASSHFAKLAITRN